MIQGNNIRIFATIILFVIGGGYLLLNRENAISQALSKNKALKDPRKISLILGLGLFGIAATCVPIMFVKVLGNKWMIFLVVLIFVTVFSALSIYEHREAKKMSASDEKEAEDHEGDRETRRSDC